METDQLVNNLVTETKPVKKVNGPIGSTFKWLAIFATYLAVMFLLFGIRADVTDKLEDFIFLVELALAITTAITAAFASVVLSVPDSYQKEQVKYLPLIPFVLLTAMLVAQFIFPGIQQLSTYLSKSPFTYECAIEMLVFSVFPIAVMIYGVKKAATTKSIWAGGTASLAAVSLSYFSLRLIEANDMPSHLLFWHYLPMLAIVFIGMLMGKWLLRW